MANRVVVITGATGGLGRVVARRLAAEGARLALFSTNAAHLEALAAELQLPAERVLLRAVDLRDAGAAQAAAQAVIAKFGPGRDPAAPGRRLGRRRAGDGGGARHGGRHAAAAPLDHSAPDAGVRAACSLTNGWGRVIAVSSPFAAQPAGQGRAPMPWARPRRRRCC